MREIDILLPRNDEQLAYLPRWMVIILGEWIRSVLTCGAKKNLVALTDSPESKLRLPKGAMEIEKCSSEDRK